MQVSFLAADLALILVTATESLAGELALLLLPGFSSSLLSVCFLFAFFFSAVVFGGGGGCISWSEALGSVLLWFGSSAGCPSWSVFVAAGVLSFESVEASCRGGWELEPGGASGCFIGTWIDNGALGEVVDARTCPSS